MYKCFFNNSTELLCIANIRGDILEANEAYCKTLVKDQGKIKLTNITNYVHIDDQDKIKKIVDSLSVNKSEVHFKSRFYTLNKSYFQADCCAYLDVENNMILFSVSNSNDNESISEQTDISMLVRQLAHEINNPLGIISGYTELIKNQTELAPNTVDKLDVILSSCTRIDSSIKNLKQTYSPDDAM